MSTEFFTDEFRTFKLVGCSPEEADFYRNMEVQMNRIRPESEIHNHDFKWKYRIEFPEQIIALHECDIWMVEIKRSLIDVVVSPRRYDTESHLVEIKKSVAHFGFPQRPGRFIHQDDLPLKSNVRAYLSSASHYMNVGVEKELITDTDPMICVDLVALPVFPGRGITYNALFYDKKWAELYYKTVETAVANQAKTISTISSYLLG
jgi:hypothetical protein